MFWWCNRIRFPTTRLSTHKYNVAAAVEVVTELLSIINKLGLVHVVWSVNSCEIVVLKYHKLPLQCLSKLLLQCGRKSLFYLSLIWNQRFCISYDYVIPFRAPNNSLQSETHNVWIKIDLIFCTNFLLIIQIIDL